MNQKLPAVICDLDGTLTNCRHRMHLLRNRNWDAFFAGIPDDPVNDWCLQMLLNHQAQGHEIIFLTGRPTTTARDTIAWINKHTPFTAVMGDNLFMRPNQDRRPGEIIKEELYLKFIAPRFEIKLALDDKPEIIQVWKKFAIPTHYCGK